MCARARVLYDDDGFLVSKTGVDLILQYDKEML